MFCSGSEKAHAVARDTWPGWDAVFTLLVDLGNSGSLACNSDFYLQSISKRLKDAIIHEHTKITKQRLIDCQRLTSMINARIMKLASAVICMSGDTWTLMEG